MKPYHGIQWLENTGGYPFVEHTLAQMPGVHRAQAADIDGDGDLDIVACALLAGGSDVDEKIAAGAGLARTDRRRARSRATRSRWDSRATPRSTSATSTATATLDIVAGNFSIGQAIDGLGRCLDESGGRRADFSPTLFDQREERRARHSRRRPGTRIRSS